MLRSSEGQVPCYRGIWTQSLRHGVSPHSPFGGVAIRQDSLRSHANLHVGVGRPPFPSLTPTPTPTPTPPLHPCQMQLAPWPPREIPRKGGNMGGVGPSPNQRAPPTRSVATRYCMALGTLAPDPAHKSLIGRRRCIFQCPSHWPLHLNAVAPLSLLLPCAVPPVIPDSFHLQFLHAGTTTAVCCCDCPGTCCFCAPTARETWGAQMKSAHHIRAS